MSLVLPHFLLFACRNKVVPLFPKIPPIPNISISNFYSRIIPPYISLVRFFYHHIPFQRVYVCIFQTDLFLWWLPFSFRSFPLFTVCRFCILGSGSAIIGIFLGMVIYGIISVLISGHGESEFSGYGDAFCRIRYFPYRYFPYTVIYDFRHARYILYF